MLGIDVSAASRGLQQLLSMRISELPEGFEHNMLRSPPFSGCREAETPEIWNMTVLTPQTKETTEASMNHLCPCSIF